MVTHYISIQILADCQTLNIAGNNIRVQLKTLLEIRKTNVFTLVFVKIN